MNLEFCQQFFEKYSHTKFRKYPTSGRRDVSCGQTERRDETDSRFTWVCERA